MTPQDEHYKDTGADEALARLMEGVHAEPVSDKLRELAERLAEVLAQQKAAPVVPQEASDQEASAG